MKALKFIFLLMAVGAFSCSLRAQPFGLLSRAPNTTLQMPQNPATLGYRTINAFGTLSFTNPVAIASIPGETNRIFVVEQAGRIIQVTNLHNSPSRTLFMDISARVLSAANEEGLLGLAFHPGFATNRFFYVFYTLNTTTTNPPGSTMNTGRHDRLARFQTVANNPNLGDANSEVPLLTQRDQYSNHNGGDLHFGPDGYLYVSLGDEGDANDNGQNSQRIDKDYFAGILRIDVDKKPGGVASNPHHAVTTNYTIPSDNPFVGATNFNGLTVNSNNVRMEFWAVGLRNPWRMSFDRATGLLYCGDVGQGTREEIDIIVKGGNYGWVHREGFIANPSGTVPAPPPNFTHINPLFDYGRGSGTNQGTVVIGGVVYRGTRLSQLTGAYIFSDAGSGNVWSLRHSGTNITEFRRLTGSFSVSAFGLDPANGDVLLANLGSDTIQRLDYNTTSTGTPLPATLSAAGVFSDLTTLTPHAGILPYDVNVPFWSDNAKKTRWFSIPNTNLTMTFSREGNWSFPTGTVWIKHFDLELTNGEPASVQRLETRLLVKNASGVYGATYRWGTQTANATLVPEAGTNESFVINDGGILRTQAWRYPGRGECVTCHTPDGGFALGFNTGQLNRTADYNGTVDNQIRALNHAGYFAGNVTNQNTLRALAHATNDAWSVEWRVRSYLAVNCAQCHQPGGLAQGNWDARIQNPLSLSGLVDGPLVNNLGDTNNRVIVPDDPAHSVLLTRIATNGSLRMPPLGSTVPDSNAIALVTAWIGDLAQYQTFVQWQDANFGSTNAPQTGIFQDFDGDGSVNFQEYLLGTDPNSVSDTWRISLDVSTGLPRVRFEQIANRGFEVQLTTSLQPPIAWQTLDVSENRPFISRTNFTATISDPVLDTTKFYRVRVFEP